MAKNYRNLSQLASALPRILDGLSNTFGADFFEAITKYLAITIEAAMSGDRQRCLNAGMNDYLSKPIKIGALKTKLKLWCGTTH
ncbi:MAG: hypothetical protein V3T17_14415 [Pseudomonadales bacterium]